MQDQFGRNVDYMRISITDRCNLRCQYCMPKSPILAPYGELLSYGEILRVCQAAATLGINKFKVTGGEALVREGCPAWMAQLKSLPGVAQVTLTTNGLLLNQHLDALVRAGVDGINISLDTLRAQAYSRLTGHAGAVKEIILPALERCAAIGIRTKVNAVLLADTFDDLWAVASLAKAWPVDVRFIELMPIGEGRRMQGVPMDKALARLQERWPDLRETQEKRGNGPALYYAAQGLRGRIGFISAVSHQFCGQCNRVRLTSTGRLQPCVCYEESTDLRALLRVGCSGAALQRALRQAIFHKPQAHCFHCQTEAARQMAMHQIGG